jgi:rRNA-processing protein FCF1
VALADVTKALAARIQALENEVLSGTNRGHLLFSAYQKWARDTIEQLRGRVTEEAADRLVRSPGYWTMQSVTVATSGTPSNLSTLIRTEAEDRHLALCDFKSDLDAAHGWRSTLGFAQLVAPDANVILHHHQRTVDFDAIDWHLLTAITGPIRVLLAHQVVDELDRLKRTLPAAKNAPQSPRARARATSRRVEDLFGDPAKPVTLSDQLVAELVLDDVDHRRLTDADSEIVSRMRLVRQIADQDVTIVTSDAGMAARARIAGLAAIKLNL